MRTGARKERAFNKKNLQDVRALGRKERRTLRGKSSKLEDKHHNLLLEFDIGNKKNDAV